MPILCSIYALRIKSNTSVWIYTLLRKSVCKMRLASCVIWRACEIAQTKGYAILATAHHADDQIETLTMRKARGAGLKGLCGIHTLSTSHGLKLWRPILHWRKSEILQKLALDGRLFRTDSSNSSLAYFRNRTRQALEALAPDDKWYQTCQAHRLF